MPVGSISLYCRYFAKHLPELCDDLFNPPNNGSKGLGEVVSMSIVTRLIESKKDLVLAEKHVKPLRRP